MSNEFSTFADGHECRDCISYEKELDTVIKIGVEGQREINRKLSIENEKLKSDLQIAVDALKEIRDYDMGRPYAYCVGFLQEEARGALKKIECEN